MSSIQTLLRFGKFHTKKAIPKSLVAVHGLNPTNIECHAVATWTTQGKLWLRDFLPLRLPTVRVLLFGYNSNVAFDSSSAGVLEQSENLLNRLKEKRRNCPNRPVVFVCHSLGGIVVKQALVQAELNITYKHIRIATHGIAFFATPHQGGNHVRLGEVVSAIARAVLGNPKSTFLEALRRNSTFADGLAQHFRHQLEDYYILSFFETRPLGRLGIIVDRKAATLGLPGAREKQIGIHANHRNICKFDGANNDVYEQVEDNMSELIQSALHAASDRERPASIHNLEDDARGWNPEATAAVTVAVLAILLGDTIIKSTPKFLSCLSVLGILTFVATKARRCMYGGLSILGVIMLPCAAFLDLFFVWCAISFSFREFIQDERIMLEGMRDLHPAGGGFSKVRDIWKYDGPHGSGDVQLFRRVDKLGEEIWELQMFVAPATAWVYYLDELQDGVTMTADTCVTQLYQSLWTFILGTCGAVCSTGMGMWIAWVNSQSGHVRFVGICLTVLRTMVVLWRWVADLIMSNHHRGAWLRHETFPEVATISCKEYRRLDELDPFSNAEFPEHFPFQTPGKQLKTLSYVVSQRMARFFQSRVIDWAADCFEVRYPLEEPLVELDVRVGNKSHKVTAPQYIADGLCTGTNEHKGLTWLGLMVTVMYAALVVTQFVLFVSNCMSVVSGSLWSAATAAGIMVTAWLTGFPLVCSGVA